MKRKLSSNVVSMHEQYPFKNSPQSLTLDAEIKRIAGERGESVGRTIEHLSEFSAVGTRQIYNYIAGKTDIPAGLIPVFCKQFDSNALAMAILHQCEGSAEIEGYDLVKLANHSAQEVLRTHQHFLEVFEDGKINGFEYNETKRKTAKAIASFQRLDQIVEDAYKRRAA